jgi:hypothetical protein
MGARSLLNSKGHLLLSSSALFFCPLVLLTPLDCTEIDGYRRGDNLFSEKKIFK